MSWKVNHLEVLRVWSRGEFDLDQLAGVSGRALGAIALQAADRRDPVGWLTDQGFSIRDIPVIMRIINGAITLEVSE